MTTELELARIIEGSETAAYRSLFATGAAVHGALAFQVRPLASATAFVSPLVGKPGVFNRVMGLGLWEPATPALLDRISALYQAAGCGFGIDLASAAIPSELPAWLRERRIRRAGLASVVCGTPHQVPGPHPRLEVVRATDDGQRAQAAAICAQVFGVNQAVQELLAALPSDQGWRHWLALLGGVPVAAALSFVHGRHCWFGWAATLPDYRGQGAKGAIDNAWVSDAHAAGCTQANSETACSPLAGPNPSFRSFQRLGFTEAYVRTTYFQTLSLPSARPGTRPPPTTPGATGRP